MTIPLQSAAVYGPVRSRRFGVSLGINLLPAHQKVCNYDCVYCQYGRRPSQEGAAFPTVREVVDQAGSKLEEALLSRSEFDWMMIAGNGEPTLHPDFPEIVSALTALRDRLMPRLAIGILSNSSTCRQPAVRSALGRLDGRYMKLDAGAKQVFCEVNRPADPSEWERSVEGLCGMKDLELQSMFFEGEPQNTSSGCVDDWIAAVQKIRPNTVQIYTIDRPPAEPGVRPASRATLDGIAERLLERTGIRGIVS